MRVSRPHRQPVIKVQQDLGTLDRDVDTPARCSDLYDVSTAVNVVVKLLHLREQDGYWILLHPLWDAVEDNDALSHPSHTCPRAQAEGGADVPASQIPQLPLQRFDGTKLLTSTVMGMSLSPSRLLVSGKELHARSWPASIP